MSAPVDPTRSPPCCGRWAKHACHAVDFWDVTNRQDWAACESVLRGLASPHFRPGPLAPNEDAVHQWVRLVAGCYLDPSGALAAACAEPAAPVETGRTDREEWAG